DIPVLGLLWALAVLMSALLLLHPGPGGSALAQHAPAAGQKTGDGRVDGRVPGSRLDNGFGADMWRSVREGIRGEVTIPDKKAAQLVQSEGDNWRNIRNGPLLRYGAYLLGGMVALLAVFYLWRGRIRIEHGRSGRTI